MTIDLPPLKTPETLHEVATKAEPGSPEWSRMVTASKVAGMLGESAYSTPYSTHCLMNGHKEDISDMTDRFNAGHAFEGVMADWLLLNHPEWRLSRGEVQVTNPHLPFPNAATPDRIATIKNARRSPKNSRTVQFKTVQDWEEWSNLTEETIPTDWLIQVTWEMLVSGLIENPAVLFVLGPYYSHQEFHIEYDADFARVLAEQVAKFLLTLDGPPPAPTSPRDYKIAKLRHPDIDDDADPVTLDEKLAADWVRVKTAQKEADAAARRAKADSETIGARVLEAMERGAEATDPKGVVIATRSATKRGVQLRFKVPKAAKAAA